jgi:AraC family transcriptional regulator
MDIRRPARTVLSESCLFVEARRIELRRSSDVRSKFVPFPMADTFNSTTLFRSPLVTVSDIRCRPSCGGCGPEEEASIHGLVFPRTGLFVRQFSAKNQVVAERTRVLFFNRNEVYRVLHPVPGGDDCTTVSFDETALLEFLQTLDPSIADSPSRPFRSTAAAASSALVFRLHRLRQLLRAQGDADSLTIEEICASLLAESAAGAASEQGPPAQPIRDTTRHAHRELVANTRLVLAREFREKLTLTRLARAVFSSPFHLARIFRRETGMSLHAHQNRLRLYLALEHLTDGARDLTRLGLDLGYSSHAHFTQAFRREFGCAPSQFRRKLSSRRRRLRANLLRTSINSSPPAARK